MNVATQQIQAEAKKLEAPRQKMEQMAAFVLEHLKTYTKTVESFYRPGDPQYAKAHAKAEEFQANTLHVIRARAYNQAIREQLREISTKQDLPENTADWFQERCEQQLATLTDDVLKKKEAYISVAETVWHVHHPGERPPSLGLSGDDDDIYVPVNRDIATICPVTRMEMTDPVKTTKCNHVFSRQGAEALFKDKRTVEASCPVVGCRQKIRRGEWEEDLDAQAQLAAMKRAAASEGFAAAAAGSSAGSGGRLIKGEKSKVAVSVDDEDDE